jgi:ASC-1-like (ASCH) protein
MPRELEKVLKINLSELWSSNTFEQTISEIKIEDILQTPFMMEIVVQVLPQMIKKEEDEEKIMEKLKNTFT